MLVLFSVAFYLEELDFYISSRGHVKKGVSVPAFIQEGETEEERLYWCRTGNEGGKRRERGRKKKQTELMKRQRQRVTEKDSVERANESEKVGAGRRRGALLELHACLSRAVTWVKCPEDVGTRAQPERWHQVQSISWVEECRWSKVTRGAVLNSRKCIHLHNLLIVELIYSWNMLKIQQDYSFPNVGICYFSWFFFFQYFSPQLQHGSSDAMRLVSRFFCHFDPD